ncbi:MAG: sodium-dependent transporter, partial [Deltaproteobacteria bacterium]|nr:sodium-dependent transporter [Deltaproteobacteria bacterium]
MLIYLLCVVLVGLPVMVAEVLIGRRGRLNPVGSFHALRPATPWKMTGFLGLLAGFMILSYYAVVAGWTVEYIQKSVTWEYADYESHVTDHEVGERLMGEVGASGAAAPSDADAALAEFRKGFSSDHAFREALASKKMEMFPERLFHDFLADPVKQIAYFLVFMVLSVLVVIGGISGGIERWNRILMPLLLLMLAVLVVRVLMLPGGRSAMRFLFWPDFSNLSLDMVLWALGQAFFSMSLGMGALLTYGSYLPKDANIGTACLAIAGLDTIVALSASVVIFGSIASYGLVMKGSGIGNLFTAIPVIFMQMPGGQWLCILFYLLVSFAALTSAVSLLEVVSSYLIDEKRMSRRRAVITAGTIIFVVGVPCALSFNLLADFKVLGRTVFDLFDFFCANLALPVGGILISVFVGWELTTQEKKEELSEFSPTVFRSWNFLVRVVAPVAILMVL